MGSGMVLFERVLQHTTSPNLLISPKFPHVPLEVGGWPLGYEE